MAGIGKKLKEIVVASLGFDSLSGTRRLATRYFLSLSVISLLAILGALLVQHEDRQSGSAARLVNIAGRQRMLSQAITKTALLVARSTDAAERQRLLEDLRGLGELWEHSHFALKQGDPSFGGSAVNGPEVREMFAALEPHYSAMSGADVVTGSSGGRIRRSKFDSRA